MTPEEALADVCRHFCAKDGTHDDACVAIRETLRQREAVLALADRADSRRDVEHRLVTTIALRAALDDRTHGDNHAPLPDGIRLDPGYCEGCDVERRADLDSHP